VVDGNVPNAVQAINEAGFTRGVYADPNYLTGPLAGSPCGSPFEVGGSPFEVGGSPFEVGGSPAGAALAQAETKIFWKQQTFTETHILPANQLLRNDIRVAVFDTIPKEGECDCDCDCNQPSDHIVNIDNQSDTNQDGQMDKQEFQIHIFPTSQTNDLQPVDPNSVDVSEHGVFIAGLINAVSGVEEIDLYEVLNSAGCGDLHVLNQALNNYSSTIQSQNGGSMKNVVINLSLGVHQPENPKDEGLPEKVFTLSEILSDAHQKGAVIVAAAGNNSAELDEPRPSDVPASYDYVIGVAASNNEDPPKRQRACYSNHGNIAAPAGDGGPFELLPPEIQEAIREANIPPDSNGLKYEDRKCLPLSIICRPDKADCEYGLASYSPGSITRYRFWAGTSFAAPLVSGIAVLTLDLGHTPEDVKNVIYGWVASPLAAPAWEPGIIRPIDTLPTPTPTPAP
jgi:subtilisin family serine protease